MIVKRIIGKNRVDLEEKVSQELGTEAIILTTTQINDHQIEATVGVEENDLAVHQHHMNSGQGFLLEDDIQLDNATIVGADDEDFWNMVTLPDYGFNRILETDIVNRSILSNNNQTLSILDLNDVEGGLESILQYLRNQGINSAIAENICKLLGQKHANIDLTIENQNKIETLKSLYSIIIKQCPLPTTRNDALVLSFVGKSAVGKTTSMLKLACECQNQGKKALIIVLEHGKPWEIRNSISIIKYFGIESITAQNSHEVKQIIDARSHDVDKFFVDTFGNPTVLHGIDDHHQYIVVSAVTKDVDSLREIKYFGTKNSQSLIVTKIDQTKTPGSLLNFTVNSQLPISYITNGSKIPKDIGKVCDDTIVKAVLSVGRKIICKC